MRKLVATVTAETCHRCCALQKYPVTIITKISTPLSRPAELPCQNTREELRKFLLTVLTNSSTPCCALQKFTVTVPNKSSTPYCALQNFSVRVPTKSSRSSLSVLTKSSPRWAMQNFPVRVPRRAAKVPCQYSPRAPPVEPCRISLSEYHEELQKFPVSTQEELHPYCAMQNFPVRVPTKSRSSLSVLTKSSPRWTLQNFPVRVSPRAAEVPCQSTHKELHPPVAPCKSSLSRYPPNAPLCVTLAAVTCRKVKLAKQIGFAVKFRQCKRWREAVNSGYSAGMSTRESLWAARRHSASWWERKSSLSPTSLTLSLSLSTATLHSRSQRKWPRYVSGQHSLFLITDVSLQLLWRYVPHSLSYGNGQSACWRNRLWSGEGLWLRESRKFVS